MCVSDKTFVLVCVFTARVSDKISVFVCHVKPVCVCFTACALCVSDKTCVCVLGQLPEPGPLFDDIPL